MDILETATGFAGDILAYSGTLFSDLGLVIVLVIGLPLGFWAIGKTIALIRAR